MSIIHNGHELTQEQLDAITPVLKDSMNGRYRTKKKFHEAIDKALQEAGCPLPVDATPETEAGSIAASQPAMSASHVD